MKCERWNDSVDGPFSEDKLKKKLESRGYSVSRYVYAPGTCFPDHAHTVDKIDAVVSGQFKMSAQGAEVVLEQGDLLEVPRGTVHNAEVVGNKSVVSLDAIRC